MCKELKLILKNKIHYYLVATFFFIHLYLQLLFIQMRIEDIIKKEIMPDHQKTVINLMITANEVSDKATEALKPYDISLQQFNVLRILRGQKGKPANLSTIQERMINKMSNTTQLVDKLITKNLVERNTCENNRRKVEIFITPEGLQLLEKVDQIIIDVEKKCIESLTQEDIIQLNTLLDKIRN